MNDLRATRKVYVQSPQLVRSQMLRMNVTLYEYFSSYGLQYSHVDFRPLFLYSTKFSLFKSLRLNIYRDLNFYD